LSRGGGDRRLPAGLGRRATFHRKEAIRIAAFWTKKRGNFNSNSRPLQGFPPSLQAFSAHRRARAGRRRVLLLGVHPVQDAAAPQGGRAWRQRRGGDSAGRHRGGPCLARCGTMKIRMPAALTAAWIARRFSSRPTSPATSLRRGHTRPPSDRKSL
jgi:hypothetical protein